LLPEAVDSIYKKTVETRMLETLTSWNKAGNCYAGALLSV
jgi:hypothetical protein